MAPLACKTDRIDAWVLAELSRRDLVPAIWLRAFSQRAERERARWRLFLVRRRSSLKHRVHAQLLAFGHACPVSDLFGARGRELLERLDFPEPWRGGVVAALSMIDDLDRQIADIERELRRLGADHRYVLLLISAPGIAWVLGYTIAAEIGDIDRFSSPAKLAGERHQSGQPARPGFVVLGEWLDEQLVQGHVTYVSWAEIRALRGGTARRLLVYLDAERFESRPLLAKAGAGSPSPRQGLVRFRLEAENGARRASERRVGREGGKWPSTCGCSRTRAKPLRA